MLFPSICEYYLTTIIRTTDELRHPFEQRHKFSLALNGRVYIAVQSDLNSAVTEYLGKGLNVKSEGYTISRERMTQAVKVNRR